MARLLSLDSTPICYTKHLYNNSDLLGLKRTIPGYLEGLKNEDLSHGVSFAYAASGYDYLTARFTKSLSFEKQIGYLHNYNAKLTKLVGVKEAQETLNSAVFVISAGTNDFFKTTSLTHSAGSNSECLNIKIFFFQGTYECRSGCIPYLYEIADQFNAKISRMLFQLPQQLNPDVRAVYVDTFNILQDAVNNPHKYVFTESSKGCCGRGGFEFGVSCRGQKNMH
ncbi:hypothetical protein AMTRI_Chr09g38870 [Amborella trichopoda]